MMNTKRIARIMPVLLIGVLMSRVSVEKAHSADPYPEGKTSPGEVRYDLDVFRKWMSFDEPEKTQHVYSDVRLSSVAPYAGEQYPRLLIERYTANASRMTDDNGLLQSIYSWDFSKAKASVLTVDRKTKDTLSKIYAMMDGDIPGLFRYLGKRGLDSYELNEKENIPAGKDVRIKYTTILEMLFAGSDHFRERECELAVANRLAEYCFGVDTWPAFKKILDARNTRPIGRFAYSTIWYYLSGTGWKHWHRNTILGLKREFKAGSRVVYIAGGNDVYQLIKTGIYDIEVIDPLLPSQPRFYAEGWDFLIKKNGIGDEIILNFDRGPKAQSAHPHLVMRRARYEEGKTFTALLHTGNKEDIQSSTTTWEIFNRDTAGRLGRLVINRRFCRQDDFTSGNGRALVMSFNELFFVATPDREKSWGIDPEKFSPDFKMYVKQLRKPVPRGMILNIRKGEQGSWRFLSLGSEVN